MFDTYEVRMLLLVFTFRMLLVKIHGFESASTIYLIKVSLNMNIENLVFQFSAGYLYMPHINHEP